ncbi:hypothetical protein MOX02_53320 [Methylobacterium oxalidis]|uniref:Uncharacterized protein n=1 Tax=Methylobacterium oxalidis TaxID=944322 RepID=A0A512JBE5_9HYPH|nr:hypothetical protein MOX02_53320 [Methylobacterium oxalidis]GLS65138.1 hypothetical protein GCM10007888_35200 [Methylobacterium oxalidis]
MLPPASEECRHGRCAPKRLPGAHYDAWLIKTSQEVIAKSRALLERTKPLVATNPAEPSVPQASRTQHM